MKNVSFLFWEKAKPSIFFLGKGKTVLFLFGKKQNRTFSFACPKEKVQKEKDTPGGYKKMPFWLPRKLITPRCGVIQTVRGKEN